MNKSKIEWCDSTWNPVTGCLHGCDYCYARRIAERFGKNGSTPSVLRVSDNLNYPGVWEQNEKPKNPYPHIFAPTFHRYRIDEPVKKTKSQTIFVCSMADLFGEWVPDEWIKEVFKVCEDTPQHRYLFLTKNPSRYGIIPQWKAYHGKLENIWLGTTVTGNKDRNKAWELLVNSNKAVNKFLSVEPLQSKFDLDGFELLLKDYKNKPTIGNYIDWVIVGAQTGLGAIHPKSEWIQLIIDQCRAAGVPIFLKDNLKWPEKIQEFPWGSEG